MQNLDKNVVKKMYGDIANLTVHPGQDHACCVPSEIDTVEFSVMAEKYEGIDGYAPEADFGLGCGIPTQYANIRKGESVLDLGSGAGNDCFIASKVLTTLVGTAFIVARSFCIGASITDINIDIASINEVDFNEEDDVNKHSMMKVNELSAAIDSLTEKRTEDMAVISSKMFNRSNFKTIDYNLNPKDEVNYENDNFLNLFQPKKQKQLYDLAISSVKSTVSIVKSNKTIQSYREQNLNKHVMTMHDKFSLGFACIILFFIGAPLGTIIRKGGYGLPLVISILLFLAYHFLGIFSKNLAEDSSINPILASWLSTLIMLPFSIYLTYRATNDQSVFNFGEYIISFFKKIEKYVKG